MIEPTQHPWVAAAEQFMPQPAPSMVKLDPITMKDDEGNDHARLLLTVATPVGVMTIFIEPGQLDVILGQGTAIQKMWKDAKSPILIANPDDMKREVRARTLLNGRGL
jgi:hypothetical protein